MKTRDNLARMVTDLANLQPNASAVAKFQQEYPDFIPESQHAVRLTFGFRTPTGEELPTTLGEDQQYLFVVKQILRSLWSGDPDERSLRDLEQVLLSGGLNNDVPLMPTFKPMPLFATISIDWKHRNFVYRPQTPLQKALHYLMQESRRAKICANPDCVAPYFIADRSNTRYCSDACLQASLRDAKRSWWEEKGTEWRKNRSKQMKQSRRKK